MLSILLKILTVLLITIAQLISILLMTPIALTVLIAPMAPLIIVPKKKNKTIPEKEDFFK